MKLLAAILSLVVLTLTLVPCQDELYGDQSKIQTELSIGSMDASQFHSLSHSCSPFCACSCSHTVKIFIEGALLGEIVIACPFYVEENQGEPFGLVVPWFRPPIV